VRGSAGIVAALVPQHARAAEAADEFRDLLRLREPRNPRRKSRPAFFAFCSVGFVEWIRCLPEAARPGFINDVLDRYQSVAADRAGEENTFKFYQMDVTLAPIF
jgi:hypothetical protein